MKPTGLSAEEQRAAEAALVLMPPVVRGKLDAVRIKLHLAEWEQLPMAERERLRDWACVSAEEIDRYHERLTAMVRTHCGKEPDALVDRGR